MKLRIFVKNIYKAALITSYFILANLKRILYSITGKNKDSYRIKTNYLIRKNNTHYNDTTKKDEH